MAAWPRCTRPPAGPPSAHKPAQMLLLAAAAASTAMLVVARSPSGVRIRDVRVEYARTPVVGVAVRRPRFSWVLEQQYSADPQDQQQQQRGATQLCYRATVTAQGVSQPAWDSGIVRSNATLGIRCGNDLASDTDYDLTVSTSASSDCAALDETAKTVRFSTALLSDNDWAGSSWLTLATNDTRNQFRGTLQLPAAAVVARGRCYIAGLGYHRSWLNGVRLAHHPDDTLGPFVQFQRRTPYQLHAIMTMLRTLD
jgi:hypothetical protein